MATPPLGRKSSTPVPPFTQDSAPQQPSVTRRLRAALELYTTSQTTRDRSYQLRAFVELERAYQSADLATRGRTRHDLTFAQQEALYQLLMQVKPHLEGRDATVRRLSAHYRPALPDPRPKFDKLLSTRKSFLPAMYRDSKGPAFK